MVRIACLVTHWWTTYTHKCLLQPLGIMVNIFLPTGFVKAVSGLWKMRGTFQHRPVIWVVRVRQRSLDHRPRSRDMGLVPQCCFSVYEHLIVPFEMIEVAQIRLECLVCRWVTQDLILNKTKPHAVAYESNRVQSHWIHNQLHDWWVECWYLWQPLNLALNNNKPTTAAQKAVKPNIQTSFGDKII